MRRPGTAPQLGLSFVFVSSRHRDPMVLVRSWCRSQALRSPRALGLPASLVRHLFLVQRWVAGSPPWVRRRAAALWPRFVSNTCRPRTAPQLGLCFVFVSSRHQGPAFSVCA
ncbi:hypothetical protein NDU88_007604 [Pleurodeles waltl]|uniref:Uncharacterized protein n=1 Tax=Pleurodeles waltl TaxID=8319 RepID=A0AAV7NYF8_PLEWA|nr:hypothetical protein NDU88_007604 [Pleurodeles waltl]